MLWPFFMSELLKELHITCEFCQEHDIDAFTKQKTQKKGQAVRRDKSVEDWR